MFTILTSLSNCFLRGGLLKRWFKSFGDGRAAFSVLYGMCAWVSTGNSFYGLAMVFIYLGTMSAIFMEKGDDYIPNKDYISWVEMVFFRGLIFALPCFVVTLAFYLDTAMLYVPAMTLMPLAYSWNIWLKKEWRWVNKWTLSELSYGLILGLPLDIMLLHRIYG